EQGGAGDENIDPVGKAYPEARDILGVDGVDGVITAWPRLKKPGRAERNLIVGGWERLAGGAIAQQVRCIEWQQDRNGTGGNVRIDLSGCGIDLTEKI